MPVSSNPHILTIGNAQYDLRQATMWSYPQDGKNQAAVYFHEGPSGLAVRIDAATWDAAKDASLAAGG